MNERPSSPARRALLLGAGAVALAACAPTARRAAELPIAAAPSLPSDVVAMYAALPGERHPVPAVDPTVVEPQFWRRVVADETGEPGGTIVVDTSRRFLFLTLGDGRAVRYGVGVGKDGLAFQGEAIVARKAEWPRWTPTADMIRREPERYGPYRDGLPGGLDNPLGARALYLHRNGRDTLYRLHGTNEPWSIGQAVSSGCIRLLNQDVIDLYRRTPVGARVVVLPHGPARPLA